MPQHHDQAGTKSFRCKLNAANKRWGYHVACHADDEEVAHTLVENKFHRHTGVGASQDDRKRLLFRNPPVRGHGAGNHGHAFAGNETAVARLELLQSLVCRYHNSRSMVSFFLAIFTPEVGDGSGGTAPYIY